MKIWHALFAFGVVALVALATWGALGLVSIATPKPDTIHHGIIEGKFTDVDGGSTVYHLLVNESGTIMDVKTDSVTWYTDAKIGSDFVWKTKYAFLGDVVPPILSFMCGLIGALALTISFPDLERKFAKVNP